MSTTELFKNLFYTQATLHGFTVHRTQHSIGKHKLSSYYAQRPQAYHRAIYLHGGGDDGFFPGVFLLNTLLKQGIEVVTFHLPGHGKEDDSIFEPHALQTCLRDVLTALQPQSERQNHIIGYSLGATIAIDNLTRYNLHCHSLTLIAMPFHLTLSPLALLWEIGSLPHSAFVQLMQSHGLWQMLPAMGWFKRRSYPIRCQKGAHYLQQIKAYIEEVFHTNKPTIQVPVHLLWGSHDRIAPTAAQEDWLKEHCSHFTYQQIKGASHFIMNFHPMVHNAVTYHLTTQETVSCH